MDESSERTQGFESASERTQYVDVHRCIREGLGGPLEQLYFKWGLATIRKRLAYQYFRAESCFLALKHFQKQLRQKIVLVSSDNSTVVSYINKEGGTPSKSVP